MGWRHLHKCVDWTLSDDLNLARSCLLDNLRLETLDEHALQIPVSTAKRRGIFSFLGPLGEMKTWL